MATLGTFVATAKEEAKGPKQKFRDQSDQLCGQENQGRHALNRHEGEASTDQIVHTVTLTDRNGGAEC